MAAHREARRLRQRTNLGHDGHELGETGTPLTPARAWENIRSILGLPRVHVVNEESSFADDYESAASAFPVRGNLVPDAHLAVILQEHGVKRLYSTDTDFRKFGFLEVINPLDG